MILNSLRKGFGSTVTVHWERWVTRVARTSVSLVLVAAAMAFVSIPALGQQSNTDTGPVVIRPGAPGQPSKILPASTRGSLPPRSAKDVDFMQGMIMHHEQAIEMTALIDARTSNKAIRLLGERISKSQTDEIDFMKRWLGLRGESTTHQMPAKAEPNAHGAHGAHGASQEMLMPGMLTPKQMEALRNAKAPEFDRLFLTGMIQHHEGALVMVKELFDSPGAGQDAELFSFARDVDNDQRAEIRTMETLLSKNP